MPGYPDYTREYNNSGDLFYQANQQWGNGATSYAVFCGQYGYTTIIHDNSSSSHYVEFTVYASPNPDGSGAIAVGQFVSPPGYENVCPVTNVFPYIWIAGNNFSVTNTDSTTLYMYATNSAPVSTYNEGQFGSLAGLYEWSVASQSLYTSPVFPAWGGVASVSTFASGVTTVKTILEVLDGEGGNWAAIAYLEPTVANVSVTIDVPLPWWPWRFAFQNSTAASVNFSLTIQPKHIAPL